MQTGNRPDHGGLGTTFRFLHTGDLHLDSPFVGLTREAPASVADVLREATFRSWKAIVQLALEQHVDFLLAGLSRSTAEQLYLALRFGLVEHFAAGAEPLPIVMDDILVNFDDERAARATRSIEELAKHQQVMYFTCHPETPVEPDAEIVLPRLVGVAEARTVGTA